MSMIRRKIFRLPDTSIKERGKEIQRVEALSDAVFAFSVSLLVAALEVPQTFHELMLIVKGALPFFATVAMIFLFWYQQYVFFRQYGLNDRYTILLNLVYLAVILFYVYPLKFLFSLLIGQVTGINLFPHAADTGQTVIVTEDFALLIILFSAGYALIWFLIYLMYQRAYLLAGKLELTPREIQFTMKEKRGAAWNMCIGLLALIMALAGYEGASGMIYMLIPFLLIVNQQIFHKRIAKLHPE